MFLLLLAIFNIQNGRSSLAVEGGVPIRECPPNLPLCTLYQGRVIAQRTLFPNDLVDQASFVNPNSQLKPEQLTFDVSTGSRDLLLEIPLIKKGSFEANAPLTVKLTVANNVSLATNVDNDMFYAISDTRHVIGFFLPDTTNFRRQAPCAGAEGIVGLVGRPPARQGVTNLNRIDLNSPIRANSPYPGRYEMTIKLNDNRGSCYTAQEAGTVKVTSYSNSRRLSLDQDISLAVYKDDDREIYGIHFVEVQVLIDEEMPVSI